MRVLTLIACAWLLGAAAPSQAPQSSGQKGEGAAGKGERAETPASRSGDRQEQANASPSGAHASDAIALESLAVDREANRIAERANEIAEAQRVYGLGQFVLGGFTAAFAGAAAFFAWLATHWAKAAAKAASAQLDALRDGERAYLSVSHPLETVEEIGSLLIGVTNSGRTAAATTEVAIALLEKLPDTPDIPEDRVTRLASNYNIPAGVHANITELTMPSGSLTCLLGWVGYVDVYGKPHQTNFCYTRGSDDRWYATGGHAWHTAT